MSTMESLEEPFRDLFTCKLPDKKCNPKKNGITGLIAKHLQKTFKMPISLQLSSSKALSQCCTGSCPNLMMNRNEALEQRPRNVASVPQLPVRTPRTLCLSLSSDGDGQYDSLASRDWRKGLQAQMEQAHSGGAASSTGSLERASLFCVSRSSSPAQSAIPSPVEQLPKAKSSSQFFLFPSPSWNSSSEADSNPLAFSGSKKACSYVCRVSPKSNVLGSPKPEEPEYFHFSEPVIARVMDCIYLGNLNAAYSGRALCKNNIDSIIDMSNLPSDRSLSIIPCTCNRGGLRHSWSRLKVDIQGLLDGKYPVLTESCFQDINECIDASLEKRKRVLIHCTDGYSLAPTCVIQYLMVKHKMRLMAAYEFVRARYPLNIRECHQNLLVGLERSLQPGDVDVECLKQSMSRKMAWT
ncbi:PREDICTED: uncharacterized protein LOC109321563 [Crocodylus porosus]|uniref:uncharacterized protein LOC109321563 n=1 Tax=Crocodylus porosus TaxID=8502 RepID=UPI0009389FEF|nr:PREDICTED: uncharacterized protein LOC109321563 [Crocodylus porosus]